MGLVVVSKELDWAEVTTVTLVLYQLRPQSAVCVRFCAHIRDLSGCNHPPKGGGDVLANYPQVRAHMQPAIKQCNLTGKLLLCQFDIF